MILPVTSVPSARTAAVRALHADLTRHSGTS
jgi:hypothetical protein